MKRMAMILAMALFAVPFALAGEPKQDRSVTGTVVLTEVTAADLAAAEACGSDKGCCPRAHRERLLDRCDGRLINWLMYRPPSTGPACCKAPDSCDAPLYTFFLDHCVGGRCPGACAAHPVNQSIAPPIAKPAPELLPAPKD